MRNMRKRSGYMPLNALAILCTTTSVTPVFAQELGFGSSVNMFGTTGLIDMPTAESSTDADLTTTISHFAGATRATLTFQASPRLSGSFRYSKIDNWLFNNVTYDRSFDVQFRVLDEQKIRPSVAVGMRDFMGTGIYSAQYLVATKTLTPKIKVTGGIGWGRFADTLSTNSYEGGGLGGEPAYDKWFSGPAGFFGGVEWVTPIKGLRFKAEYSSDNYAIENTLSRDEVFPNQRDEITFDRKSPLNFGVEYTPIQGLNLGLYYLHGSEIGVRVSTALNLKNGGQALKQAAPLPITPRKRPIDRTTDWQTIDGINARGRKQLNTLLNKDGIRVEALVLREKTAELRFRNGRYLATPQAFGRVARAMAYVMPDSVDTFVLTPVVEGIGVSSITMRRSDLERLENAPNNLEESAKVFSLTDAAATPKDAHYDEGLYPKLTWSLAPYVTLKLFDSEDPFALGGGLRLKGSVDISPGLSVSGAITKQLIKSNNNVGFSNSVLEPVRTNNSVYRRDGDPGLNYLTADYLFKVSPAVYGRVSAGYLERMFGGVSTELLWKPAEQNWGLGAELNYVKQRDFDQRFGFQDYSVVTGHVSGYFQLGDDYALQIDAGRYLAGDVGATVSIDRTFDNGWSVGAYATLTDVPFEDYGEGSFDKGIRMTVPLSFITGNATRKTGSMSLSSLQRDGGARLKVNNRLYPMIKDYHQDNIAGSWGRFWR